METANSVGQLISNFGFPIVCCGALFWFIIRELRDCRKIIENNTNVLNRILEHIKKEEDN